MFVKSDPTRPVPAFPTPANLPSSAPAVRSTAMLNDLYSLLTEWARNEPNPGTAGVFVKQIMTAARAGETRVEGIYPGLPPDAPSEFRIEIVAIGSDEEADQNAHGNAGYSTLSDVERMAAMTMIGMTRLLTTSNVGEFAASSSAVHATLTQETQMRGEVAALCDTWHVRVQTALSVKDENLVERVARGVALGSRAASEDYLHEIIDSKGDDRFRACLLLGQLSLQRSDHASAAKWARLAGLDVPPGKMVDLPFDQHHDLLAISAQAHLLGTGGVSEMPKAHHLDMLTAALAARAAGNEAAYGRALVVLNEDPTPRHLAQLSLLHAMVGESEQAYSAMKCAIEDCEDPEHVKHVGSVLNSPFWQQATIDLFWLGELRRVAKSR